MHLWNIKYIENSQVFALNKNKLRNLHNQDWFYNKINYYFFHSKYLWIYPGLRYAHQQRYEIITKPRKMKKDCIRGIYDNTFVTYKKYFELLYNPTVPCHFWILTPTTYFTYFIYNI